MTTPAHLILRFLSLGLPGLVILGATGCESPDVSELREQGIQQYRTRQYVESSATLRYALKRNPSDAPSAYYMGLNHRAIAARKFAEGDVPGARRQLDIGVYYFSQAIKHWPNYQAAVQAKADALILRDKYDRALDTADTVAENNKGRSVAHLIFSGDLYRDRGDYDRALEQYDAALAADPGNAKAYASLGRLYTLIGDNDKAMDAYSHAHQLDPGNAEVSDQLARLGGGTAPTPPPPEGHPGPPQ